MTAQGEQGQVGSADVNVELVESMAQDEITMQVDYSPQPNPESEMGAATGAAAREHPQQQAPLPVPSETTTDRSESASSGSADINQLGEMLRGMMQEMNNNMMQKLDENMQTWDAFFKRMRTNTQTQRGEMQSMGVGLQTGLMSIAHDETRTTEHKMVAPGVGANELGGECGVCPAHKGDG